MALRRIVQIADDNPVLRREARPVHKINRQIRKLLDDMVETMREADGVGLAGPQVGMDLALFVAELPVDVEDPESGFELFALINPEITDRSEEQIEGREACLSIPDLFGDVPRHTRIRVEALDRFGAAVELELEDFAARVFQHEIDHLHGILFLDRVTGLDKVYQLEEDEDGEMVRVPLG
jgi:peptide deformylase